MRKYFIRIMVTISIVLFLFGIYRYNFPGISMDDIDYKEIIVEVENIKNNDGSKFAVFTINNNKEEVYLQNMSYENGDIITVYKFKDEFYISKDELLIAVSGSMELIVWSIVCFFATITYAVFSGRIDYKSENEIKFEFAGLNIVTKENFNEKMENLNLRKSLIIYPFSVVLWITAIGILCGLFGENGAENWFVYILMSGILFILGNFMVICGSIKYKCKKALRSKGEVYIGECYYKFKDIKITYLADDPPAKSYFIKVCDVNGKLLNEWIEVNKKLYDTVTEETKLNLVLIKIDGLIKFFVVEEKIKKISVI